MGSASNCLRCANSYKSFNDNCVEECPPNYLDTGITCTACDASCIGCSGSTSLCERCSGTLIKVNGRCITGCPDGQFYVLATESCLPCGSGCSRCSSITQCFSCFDPALIPVEGECVQPCPLGAIFVGSRCVCNEGNLLGDVCVDICPERFVSVNGICQLCQNPCRDC